MQKHVETNPEAKGSKQEEQPQIIVVTGQSGAGKNTVMHSLEDIGYYCIANLPIALIEPFFKAVSQAEIPNQRIALSLDVRGQIPSVIARLVQLKIQRPFAVKVVFVTSSHSVLLKRFQETRRKHPLADKVTDVSEAIFKEQDLLDPLGQMADIIVDTDQFTIHQLRRFIIEAFTPHGQQHMVVSLTAFGFKYGVPTESNLVFDVRFLPNPYFDPQLKHLNGTDEPLRKFLFAQKEVVSYWDHLIPFATYVINQSLKEGRFSMHIAIGCTGGRHRSVAFVHRFAQQKMKHITFLPRYRDMEK